VIRAHINEMTVEEVANVVTHGAGLVLSIFGSVVLLALSVAHGDRWHIAASTIYGSSLVTLYAASTVYHTVISPAKKRVFQLLDHSCIYLLIAGTYTPFLMTLLRNDGGSGLLAFVWGFAAIGITLKLIFRERFDAVGIVLYLLMGWAGIVLIKPVYDGLGVVALALVIGGGISYTLGMIFFGWHRIKHHHAIFHIFVLGGSILHYAAILGYLLPHS